MKINDMYPFRQLILRIANQIPKDLSSEQKQAIYDLIHLAYAAGVMDGAFDRTLQSQAIWYFDTRSKKE